VQKITAVYWVVQPAIIDGLLVRVRTTLAELVAELAATIPAGQNLPDRATTDRAFHVVIEGDGNSLTLVGHQWAGGDSTVRTSSPQPVSAGDGWWKRLRKRVWIVALSTFVAAVVGVFAWLDCKPWG
jgi:hypothetical protein